MGKWRVANYYQDDDPSEGEYDTVSIGDISRFSDRGTASDVDLELMLLLDHSARLGNPRLAT
jgi:hypothetical protein